MPRDSTAPIIDTHNVMCRGERPRTRFLDWFDAINVRLVNGPRLDMIHRAMAGMREASYSPDLGLALERADHALADDRRMAHPLSLAVEVPHFTFLISGVSRAMTHQIVRTRIGVTYAQKCTGDGDLRHDDALVMRGPWLQSENLVERYIEQVLNFKHWYAEYVDSGCSIHTARYLMPHCLSQYIYVDISLLALQMLYGKRSCPEQPSEWRFVLAGMKASMEPEYPEFAALLVSDCVRKTCHWHRKGNNDPYLGRLFFPDAAHDKEPWNPLSFVHQGTRAELEDGLPFPEREYIGYRRLR